MTFPAYPYPVAAFADRLLIESVVWRTQRYDELSGTGDGDVWQAELNDPRWAADVKLTVNEHNAAKQIAALQRQLHGARESFYLFDPVSPYPQADPDGSIVGATAVKVLSVGAGRQTLRLKSLPIGYTLTLGDKMQITYSTTKNYFVEVSETVVADGSGITAEFKVFPNVPTGVALDDAVNLKKPACKGFIMPGSLDTGTAADMFTRGAGFVFMERFR